MTNTKPTERTFVGTPPYTVTFDGRPLEHRGGHSRDFCWGYGGSGPADLAFSIIAAMIPEAVDDVVREIAYQFKWEIVAKLPQDKAWILTHHQVRNWIALWHKEAEHAE